MKNKEWQELKSKSIENLKKFISDKQKELISTRLKLRMSKVKNVHLASQMKKDIAKAQTVLSIKQFMEKTRIKMFNKSKIVFPLSGIQFCQLRERRY